MGKEEKKKKSLPSRQDDWPWLLAQKREDGGCRRRRGHGVLEMEQRCTGRAAHHRPIESSGINEERVMHPLSNQLLLSTVAI